MEVLHGCPVTLNASTAGFYLLCGEGPLSIHQSRSLVEIDVERKLCPIYSLAEARREMRHRLHGQGSEIDMRVCGRRRRERRYQTTGRIGY